MGAQEIKKISVIIPVKNGSQTLEKCLQSIRKQTCANEIEIIILDSQSTDNSRDIAALYGAMVIEVKKQDFNHGLTRNLGVKYASGELLFFTVQDAFMADEHNLENMKTHFRNDTAIMAVCGQQAVPWGEMDKNPVLWFKRYSYPQTVVRNLSKEEFLSLPGDKQLDLCRWDNVNAMYSKFALINIPFRETNYCEDLLWAKDALSSGYKILIDTSLLVYHYHHMYFLYTFKATFILDFYFYKHFGISPSIAFSPLSILKSAHLLIFRPEVPFIKKIYWLCHNMCFHISSFFAKVSFRILRIFDEKMLEKFFKHLCDDVPQGQIKRS